MSALTVDTPLVVSLGDHADLPIDAAVKIYLGSIVGLKRADGYARAFALGDRFSGHAVLGYDNLLGAAGAANIKTKRGRYFLQAALSGVAITDAVHRAPVFAQDSGTLSLRSGQLVGRVVRYVSSGIAIVEFDTDLQVHCLSETITRAAMTDNTDTTGYKDFATALPKGGLVLGWQAKVQTGFTGDTTAVIQVGIAGTLDRFSAGTAQSVLAAGTVGAASQQISGKQGYLTADTTVRATITGGADFTNIAAGELDLKVFYLPVLTY